MTGFSMRTAVTSVGAVLGDVQRGLHTTALGAGVITTLPVLCFAGIGSAAPRLTRRYGDTPVLVAALAAATLGMAVRVLANSLGAFVAASVLALAGGAVANVTMPTLVKRFADGRLAMLTAVYTTAMAAGATAASGLTVPIGAGHGSDGWRRGLGGWAVLAALAVPPWLAFVRRSEPAGEERHSGRRGVVASPTAWALTLIFGGQSFQAYVAFGWFARFFRDHGVSAAHAGVLVAFYAALSIPTAALAPWLAAHAERGAVVGFCACYLAGYVGMGLAPVGGAWLWMLLVGTGGGLFPMALTMIGLHTRDADLTAALSSFVQGVGYILASSGPVLVGWLLGPAHRWTGPFACLYAALAVCAAGGLLAARGSTVDAELSAAQRVRA